MGVVVDIMSVDVVLYKPTLTYRPRQVY